MSKAPIEHVTGTDKNTFDESKEKQFKEAREESDEILENSVANSGKDSPIASFLSSKHKEHENATGEQVDNAFESAQQSSEQIAQAESEVDKTKQKDLQKESESTKGAEKSGSNENDSGMGV